MHLDSPEALGVLNTLFETVAPSSLRPVDMLLKSMFTTPVTMVRDELNRLLTFQIKKIYILDRVSISTLRSRRRQSLRSSCGCPVSWRCSGCSSPSPPRTSSCPGSTSSPSRHISSPATQSVACISRARPRVTPPPPTHSVTRKPTVRPKKPNLRKPLPGQFRVCSRSVVLGCFVLSSLSLDPCPLLFQVPAPAGGSAAG